jgi:hypothetical protein
MAYLEYPKHLSHKDHSTHRVVKNRDEEDSARGEGWDDHGNVVAAREAEKNKPPAGTSKPSATELKGAPLSMDPSDVDPDAAAIVEDAADGGAEDTEDPTDAAERPRRKHSKK